MTKIILPFFISRLAEGPADQNEDPKDTTDSNQCKLTVFPLQSNQRASIYIALFNVREIYLMPSNL